jgi:hypothetical protein
MLFKNNQPFTISKEQKKELLEVIGEFPVTVKWCDHKIRKHPLNKIPDQPPAMGIKTAWTVTIKAKNKTEASEKAVFQYAESYDVDPDKKINIYTPASVEFSGFRIYEEIDIEWVWFLWYCFPLLEGGYNANPKTSKFEIKFHLPRKEKAKSMAIRTKFNKAEGLILGDAALPEERLRELLTGYFIPGVDNMTLVEVQDALINHIQRGKTDKEKMDNVDHFISLTGNEKAIYIRFCTQRAIDKKLVEYDSHKRQYYMIVEGKRWDEPICTVPANDNPSQYLFEILASPIKADVFQMIEVALKSMDKEKSKKDKGE